MPVLIAALTEEGWSGTGRSKPLLGNYIGQGLFTYEGQVKGVSPWR